MRRECAEISRITGEHAPGRFGERDHERVHSRSPLRAESQQGGATCCLLRELGDQIAGLEKTVRVRVPPRTSGNRFDDHDRWNGWRPESIAAKNADDGGRLSISPCKSRDSTAVEHQHDSAGAIGRVERQPPRDGLGPSDLVWRRFAHLVDRDPEDHPAPLRSRVVDRTEYGRLADALTAELHRLGWWPEGVADDAPASPEGGAFGLDAMPFPHWLARVLVPRLREVAAGEMEPPGSSQVAAQAVRELDGVPDAGDLVDLLHQVDALVG